MKSAVETVDATKVKLTVEVPYEELKPSIDHAYAHIAGEVTVPGFRKGKVPPRIIDQRVGRSAVLEHAINEGMSGFYSAAVRDNKLRPLGQPEIEVTQVPEIENTASELHFVAQVEVRPEIEIPSLEGITVSVDDLEVTDEDVATRLDALRERFGTLVGVDRPAGEGDFVVLDLVAKVEGDEVDNVSGISYQIGSGNMLEGLDEALTGLSAGETTTFSAPLAGGEHEGEQADITVTATTVKQRDLPAADDDFAQLASEFDTLAELEADLREQAGQGKASGQAVQARDRLLEQLLAAAEIPVPSGVIEAEATRHLESEGRLEDDEHRAEVIEQATTALQNQILLDTLAEQLEVKVNQNELLEYLVSASRQYGMDPNEFIKTIDEQGQVPAMVAEVARSKALAVALRRVSITDAAGNAVDLSEYIGSDEDDEAAEKLFDSVETAADDDSDIIFDDEIEAADESATAAEADDVVVASGDEEPAKA
ncbi:trigger factor [Pengzhenrongella sp.]|uniref:trigger factor n=1 Tax=Pengzhenrongella sp. TaxID=2888820 RepID=UPI002F9278A1